MVDDDDLTVDADTDTVAEVRREARAGWGLSRRPCTRPLRRCPHRPSRP